MMTRPDALLAQIRLCQTMLHDLPHLFAESTRGDIEVELDRLIGEHLHALSGDHEGAVGF